jgi:SAM-dependent methyltransferase
VPSFHRFRDRVIVNRKFSIFLSMPIHYDAIGRTYGELRRPDSRIASSIWNALGHAQSLLNVGAGTGSYEPDNRNVVAVEPSAVMIAQRRPGSAPVVRGCAESLPFANNSFDAVLATLTIHHWLDQRVGLSECKRVARDRTVIFTWDPSSSGFWLVQEYFPEILELDRRIFPTVDEISGVLGDVEVLPVEIPADCADGFLGAYWRRPEMYLSAEVRKGISAFSSISGVQEGISRLERDLATGKWKARHADLLSLPALDIGYRVIVANQ